MEKITNDELLEKLGAHAMSDDELEQVAAGGPEGICLRDFVWNKELQKCVLPVF